VDLIAPGFVDLQVNGIDDVDVATADGADWDRLGTLLVAQGVTTWCPTLVTMALDRYAAPLARIADAMHREPTVRPSIAGAHLEGPFLGGAVGAHPRDMIADIDLAWIDALPGHVAMVTIGPEQPLAVKAIGRLRDRGVLVALGHTTATDDDLDRAAARGAALVTHLFNGMSGLHHRTPGVAAWALTHPSVSASIIADGVHVHPRMLRLAFLNLGQDRAVLVTDSVAWRAGSIGSIGVALTDGAPRLPDGTLAGSALTMDAAIRTCVAAGVPLEAALTAAGTNPARLLGLHDRGAVEVGLRADLVGLSTDLTVTGVWIGGTPLEHLTSPER
jgi:N-acetylglucosamine-6-phosphate deacetylase